MSDLYTCRLVAPVPAAFAAMTYPVYRHLLTLAPSRRHPEQNDPRPILPIAIGAWANGTPAALLLAEIPLPSLSADSAGEAGPGASTAVPAAVEPSAAPASGAAVAAVASVTAGAGTTEPVPALLSIFVQPAHRRRGVAAALLDTLVGELAGGPFPRLEAVYTTGRPGSEAAERLLQRSGWSAPEARTVMVHLGPAELAASPLFEEARLQAIDPGFEIFPWADLSPAERDELRVSDERSPWVTPGLAAWKYDHEPFDTAASVGARYRGQVVGWVIAQPIHATAVRYLASFMRKDLSRRGRILPLYRASLLRAAAAGHELATFVTPVTYASMIRFIHRWMAPHARLVAETRGCSLQLPSATALDEAAAPSHPTRAGSATTASNAAAGGAAALGSAAQAAPCSL